MKKKLMECCEAMLRLLNKLLEQGKISSEEYEKHKEHKVKFLEQSKTCGPCNEKDAGKS